MKMKLLAIISFLLLLCSLSFAQLKAKPEAELIDYYGESSECVLSNRLDTFFVVLMNNKEAKGYAIFYKSAKSLPSEIEALSSNSLNHMRNYIRYRRFDADRITLVDGGFREEMETELWLVPEGAEIPKPSKTVPKPIIPTNKTFLFDRGYIESYLGEFELPAVIKDVYQDIDLDAIRLEETDDGLTKEERNDLKIHWVRENFGEFVKKNNDTKGIIIYYADKDYYDLDKITIHIEEARKRIVANSKLSPEQIQIFYGGYRSMIDVEYWIMTKNSGFPELTPEVKEDENSTNE